MEYSNLRLYFKRPDPVGVGQSLHIAFWLNVYPPSASGAYGDRWENLTINVTKPDGSTEILGPYSSDPAGSNYISWTPTTAGNYSFQFIFPGQTLAGSNPAPNPNDVSITSPYIGDDYEPSESNIEQITVQEQQLSWWSNTPLPTEYWTRPISALNSDWYTISGNWLMIGYDFAGTAYNPYTLSPDSAHILWTKPLTYGGIADGQFGSIPYYAGNYYEPLVGAFITVNNPLIIINGVLYYNQPVAPLYGIHAVDIRTGNELWYQNTTDQLAFGQLLHFSTPNQDGVIPYLWSTSGTSWKMYDATTGNYILTVNNVPSGTRMTDSNGNILIYTLNAKNGWLTQWNSTTAIMQNAYATGVGTLMWSWRPGQTGTNPVATGAGSIINGTNGYDWNVTVRNTDGTLNSLIGTGTVQNPAGTASISKFDFEDATCDKWLNSIRN